MAEIKIEHKQRSSSAIWWIVGLVVLALLAWWLLSSNTGTRTAAAGGDVTTTSDGAVTSLIALTTATNADLAGRPVRIPSAPVNDVVSDNGFWVGDANARAFVIRDNTASAATPPDGAVNAGQTVAIWGTAERMPSDLTQQGTAWNLRATDLSTLSQQALYVRADSVRILAR